MDFAPFHTSHTLEHLTDTSSAKHDTRQKLTPAHVLSTWSWYHARVSAKVFNQPTNEPANQTVQPLGRPFARNWALKHYNNVVILTWSTTSSPLLSFPLYAVAGSTGQVPSTSNRPSHLLTIIISITRSGRQHLLPLVVSSFFPQLVNQASRQAQSVSHHQRRHLPFLYWYDTEEHCGILTKVRKSFTSDSLWVFYKIKITISPNTTLTGGIGDDDDDDDGGVTLCSR